MNWLRRHPMNCILSLFLLFPAGCADSGSGEAGIPNPVDISLIASQVSMTLAVGLDHYGIARRGLSATSAPGDTLLKGQILCPLATTTTAATGLGMMLQHGRTGCLASSSGHSTLGSVRYDIRRPSGKLILEESLFDRFSRQGASLDGFLSLEGTLFAPGDQVTVRAQALNYAAPGGSGSLGGSFFAIRRANVEDPNTPLCLLWSVNEGTVAIETGNRPYAVAVQEPLSLSTCCGIVTQGILLITANGFLPATVDFGEGVCDQEAVMRSGAEVISLILSGS